MDVHFSYSSGTRFGCKHTGSENEYVELVLLFGRLDTFRCDLQDGTRINVDKVDVVLVEDFVEILL